MKSAGFTKFDEFCVNLGQSIGRAGERDRPQIFGRAWGGPADVPKMAHLTPYPPQFSEHR
jgi:hypothetical protein